jgi:hypothetical protein
MSLTYEQFTRRFEKEPVFCKLLNNKLKHIGFQYKLGLNVDTNKFNPSENSPGGLNFTTEEHVLKFTDYGLDLAIIELCKDAQFYCDPDGIKFKTDKFIIKSIKEQTEEFCKFAVKQYSWTLKHVKIQTLEICELAIRGCSTALQYVREQTPYLCELAVKDYGDNLQIVKEQTPKICELAVQENGLALRFVEKQTERICNSAVQQNWKALQYVNPQFRKMFVNENL